MFVSFAFFASLVGKLGLINLLYSRTWLWNIYEALAFKGQKHQSVWGLGAGLNPLYPDHLNHLEGLYLEICGNTIFFLWELMEWDVQTF